MRGVLSKSYLLPSFNAVDFAEELFYLSESIICCCCFVCSGLKSLSTIFQSYHDGVWLRQGAQCSLL